MDFPCDFPLVKFKRSGCVGKQVVASFFEKAGQFAAVPLLDRSAVSADWYIDHCPPDARAARREVFIGIRGCWKADDGFFLWEGWLVCHCVLFRKAYSQC